MKRIFSGLLAIVMAVTCLTGCGKNITIEELLKEMAKANQNITSVTMDYKLDFGMKGTVSFGDESEDIDISYKLDGSSDMNVSPLGMKGTLNMDVKADSDNEKAKLEYYMTSDDDTVNLYYKMDDTGWYGSTVSKDEIELDEASKIATDSDKMADINVIELLQLEISGKETINNKKTYVVTGTLDTEAMEKMIGEESDTSLEDSELGSMLSNFEIPFTIYVDQDTYQVVRFEIDLKSTLSVVKAFLGKGMEITASECYIDFSNYNEGKEIKVPADVKKEAEKNNIDVLDGMDDEY